MNLSAIRPRKSGTEVQAATETARRNVGASNGSLLFRDTRPVVEAVAKGLREVLPVQPVAPSGGSIDGVLSVVKAMNEGIAQLTAAIKTPVAKAAPTPAPRSAAAAPASPPVTQNTALATVAKRARVAEIAAEEAQRAPQRATKVLSPSGNAPFLPIETEAQRRRSHDDAVTAQRAAEKAATDRILVSKGGAKVMTLRALDTTLSSDALIALAHIIDRWQAADRRPVRVRASDLSEATGMTYANAQAVLDELEAKKATITSINSVGTRLVMPGLAVAGV